ncbi:hypothetical protein NDCJBJIB_01769 [Mannheimia haemolytica]
MRTNPIFQILVIIAIFVVAFVLEIMPWPVGFKGYALLGSFWC